jgi:hypothetical protein
MEGSRHVYVLSGKRAIGMVVDAAVFMHMPDRARLMDMHDPDGVIVIGETRRGQGSVGEREAQRRRENAKRIDQRKELPCPHPPRSRQTH